MVDLFGPNGSLTWWQECDRALVVFVFGLIMVRVAGRRTFSKWGALDIIVSIIVGSNLSRTLTGSASLGGTLAATTLIMALHWVLAKIATHSKRASQMLEGVPAQLAQNGQLDQQAVNRHSISRADIEEALRGSQVEDLSAVRLLMLEPSGKITVLKG